MVADDWQTEGWVNVNEMDFSNPGISLEIIEAKIVEVKGCSLEDGYGLELTASKIKKFSDPKNLLKLRPSRCWHGTLPFLLITES